MAEIQYPITQRISAMTRLCNVTCNNKKTFRKTRKSLIQTLVLFVFLYVAETWMLKADNKRRRNASISIIIEIQEGSLVKATPQAQVRDTLRAVLGVIWS